ncbi:hypothetical protein I6H07_13940 [Hafnia alvei]|uniref:hypothetical protein n=1 Tax=Hafnia alvei TaxID=569 RepID=UPI001642BACA|nr:hypothetical protein [Hafnia alvei]MBI0276879.1 hypothetical protein [Hafnia alvei]
MNPSPLTGERLAIVLEYRHTFFLVNPNQRVCSSTCFWLTHWRLGAASLLLHCLSAAV